MKLRLIENYRQILWHSWSARLSYLLVLINAMDAGFYFFIGYAPLPQWALGLISAAFGVAIPIARSIVQSKLSGAPTNADQ